MGQRDGTRKRDLDAKHNLRTKLPSLITRSHPSLALLATDGDQSGTRRIEASRVVVLEMVELAAMRSVSCMVLMLNVRQIVRICSRSAKKVRCCSLKYRRY